MATKQTQPKAERTILAPDLSQAEQAMLAQVALLPGWKILVKILNDAGVRAMQDIVKLDPESEDYERVAVERQRRARYFSEFNGLIVDSVSAHTKAVRQLNTVDQAEEVDAAFEKFGIRNVNKSKTPAEAIRNTFGIHPARPKKAAAK